VRIRWRLLLPSTNSKSTETSPFASQSTHVNWHRSWLTSPSWKCLSSSQPGRRARLVRVRHAIQGCKSSPGVNAVHAAEDDQATTNRYVKLVMEGVTEWMACTATAGRKY